jgi:hypothetical protein
MWGLSRKIFVSRVLRIFVAVIANGQLARYGGYEDGVDGFIQVSQALDFAEINQDFLDFLPPIPNAVLDAGAGARQNAAALARMGYSVVAVEPLAAFSVAARSHDTAFNMAYLGLFPRIS